MFDVTEYEVFNSRKSTLKNLSKDDSNLNDVVYMTESSLEAIDFDKVKTAYINCLGLSEEKAKSFDALAFMGDGGVFIEFKNGNMKNEKQSVKIKIRDSLLIFCDIVKCHISDTRENFSFILVYNKEKNSNSHDSTSRTAISNHLMNQANMEIVRFGLEKFQDLYFKEVHTYNEEEFEEYLKLNFPSAITV